MHDSTRALPRCGRCGNCGDALAGPRGRSRFLRTPLFISGRIRSRGRSLPAVGRAADRSLVRRPRPSLRDRVVRLERTGQGAAAKKAHRVLRLEDTNDDGVFDRRTVFADGLMFPEGVLWLDGVVLVAACPEIWKLADTNDDGVADSREVWFDGKTLTGCANDLHGPYRGPDGWIYWCKGGFAEHEATIAGRTVKTKASHVYRARPDGSGAELVASGGMDNPVGLAWSAEGELIPQRHVLPASGRREARWPDPRRARRRLGKGAGFSRRTAPDRAASADHDASRPIRGMRDRAHSMATSCAASSTCERSAATNSSRTAPLFAPRTATCSSARIRTFIPLMS